MVIRKEGPLDGYKWQVEPLDNLHAWGRRDNNGKKGCKPPRQYLGVWKALQNLGE